MDVRPIRNDDDHEWALREISAYFDNEPKRGSPDGDRLEVLLALVGIYEDEHFPIGVPDPVDFLNAWMEMTGRSKADFAKLVGSASQASEILNGTRPLTMPVAQRLSAEWDIPDDVLLRPLHSDAA